MRIVNNFCLGSTDPTASLDLQCKVSLFLHSTYHYWSLKMQAIHIGSYPGQRAVNLNASDKHWPLRNVHFVNTDLWDTAKFHRIMSIAMYDYSLWWRAVTTNENKSERSMSLCQDLVDFILFVSFLKVVDHTMAGWSLWSLLALTYAENTMTHIFGGKVSYWVVRGHLLADNGLEKIVAAKMIGMPLPVDCWRPGIWWWDSWCSSRYHCYEWVCRYWCQCCEWAWQY